MSETALRGINTAELEQIRQLINGPVWDGNLVSKHARDRLVTRGKIGRLEGWNFLTQEGVRMLSDLGYLKP